MQYLARLGRVFFRIGAQQTIFDGLFWGIVRLLGVAVIISVFTWFGRGLWTEPGTQPIRWLSPWAMRYWALPLAAFVGALLAGANYLRRLYQLPTLGLSLRRLASLLFTIPCPWLEIQDGAPVARRKGDDLIVQTGGPGILRVRPNSAVMLESFIYPTRVLGAGWHFINRFERIREMISLADQQGSIEEVCATTKDGITLAIQNIQYRYRLRTGSQPRDYQRRTANAPYPFSVQAARRIVYDRSVRQEGPNATAVTPWDSFVQFRVDGIITDYIRSHTFDQVYSPRFNEILPRAQIAAQMQSQAWQGLRLIGTELIWFDIGHFEPVLEDVSLQHIDNWAAAWDGLAGVNQAWGEADRLIYHEMGRAEAQAEILQSILASLPQERSAWINLEKLRSLILLRTAQLLDTMTEAGYVPDGRPIPIPPESLTIQRMKNPEVIQVTDGSVAIGREAMSSGKGGVLISGSASRNATITGNNNSLSGG